MCADYMESIPITVAVGSDGRVKIATNDPFYLNWKRESWAREQLDAALRDLGCSPESVEPFRYFLIAMHKLSPAPGARLLDVGCGVGMYSALMDRYFPEIEYTGFDFSEAMIALAKKNFAPHRFFVADFKDVDYSEYDIVLCSGLITVSPEFKEIVDLISEKSKDVVIWHRVFVTEDQRPVSLAIADSYGGERNYHFYFNRDNLIKYFLQSCIEVEEWTWEQQRKGFQIATIMCRKHSLDESAGIVPGTEA